MKNIVLQSCLIAGGILVLSASLPGVAFKGQNESLGILNPVSNEEGTNVISPPSKDAGEGGLVGPPSHTITVTVTDHEDIRVEEGQSVGEGDVVSDRVGERERLLGKKKQLEMAIEQMSLPLSEVALLPDPNYEQEVIALKKARFNLEQADRALADYPGSRFLDSLLEEVHDTERVKEIAKLRERRISAAIAVEAAVARLSEAKTRYQQQKYQHSIHLTAHETNLQRQQYQLASLRGQLQKVEADLEELVAVRSPFSGMVRRVRFVGQNERSIRVEIVLDTRGG